MKNLENAIRNFYHQQLVEYTNLINNTEHSAMMIKRDAPTNSKKYEKLTSDNEKISFIIEREKKDLEKRMDKDLAQLTTIWSKNQQIEKIVVSVEWKKSNVWGSNPSASAKVYYNDGSANIYESGSVGGCGYDKESTAIAKALNQSNALIKLLCIVKEEAADKKNHEVFGYGSGYRMIPQFEGGVGVSCYYSIFEKIGFKMNKTAAGKTFDVWTIEKI